MMSGQRVFGAVVIALLMAGCGEDGSPPVGPSPSPRATPAPGRAAAVSVPSAVGPDVSVPSSSAVGPDVSVPVRRDVGVLKSTAPTPVEPIDNIEIDEVKPLLVASRASGEFVEQDFGYEFAVHSSESCGAVEFESGNGMPRDSGETSYQIQKSLELGSTYAWQVRAAFEGSFGPWSKCVTFRTVPVRFGGPLQLVSPIGGTVGNRPVFVVRSGAVEGDAERVVIQVRLAPEGSGIANAGIAGEAETTGRAGEEKRISLRSSYRVTPDTSYLWQARTVVHTRSSRVFNSPWSRQVKFRTTALSLGAPRPVAPVGGATVGTEPDFLVRNGAVQGNLSRIVVRVDVGLSADFAGVRSREVEMQGRAGGNTRIRLQEALRPGTSYFWRARAMASSALYGPVVSQWSATARFMTRAGTSLGPVKSPPPNLLHVVQRVGAQYPQALKAAYDDHSYEFLDRVVAALREEDGGRWGVTHWTRPGYPDSISIDRAGYYTGNGDPNGSTEIVIIDFLSRHNRHMAWFDDTRGIRENYPDARGTWKYPR